MSLRASDLDMQAIGINRRLTRWFAYYVLGLWCALAAWIGVLAMALVGMAAIEMVSLFWARIPPQSESYIDTTPAGWQAPVRALRWYLLIRNIAGLASGALVITVVMVVIAVVARPTRLGTNNLIVVIVIGLWLATRPIWFPRLAKAFLRSFQGIETAGQPAVGAKVSTTADGIDIAAPPQDLGNRSRSPSWIFHVAFSEIDELRMLGDAEAQAYGYSMAEYDPTFAVRVGVEVGRYANGQIPRPTIYVGGVGPCLLIRGSNLLYLIGLADDSGPAAVAAWQTWRAAQSVAQAT